MIDLKKKFKKNQYENIEPEGTQQEETARTGSPEIPDGLFRKCNYCGSTIVTDEVKRGYYICPKCGAYFRLPAYRRIRMITDEGSFEEWDMGLDEKNPLEFRGYDEKLKASKRKTGLDEAVVTGRITIKGIPAVIGVCDGRFMMASMGQVVGEKITRAVERATEEKLPVILFTCSGGARMQEGIISLMQMAKTSAALKRHSEAGLLYVTVLTDPTTGGVTASFAMLGDIILAEPGALVGFAGPRVIEQTIRQKLPKGFQRAEFLLEHGFVDQIVKRENMRQVLGNILLLHAAEHASCNRKTISSSFTDGGKNKFSQEGADLLQNYTLYEDEEFTISDRDSQTEESEKCALTKETEKHTLSAWDRIQISRQSKRPVGSDYIQALFEGFMEFHGDRYCKDDAAIIGGIASFCGIPVTVIAQEKGKNTKDNMKRNFGMPSPDGYRKALRLMKQAEKFHRPVICFVDTPGAFCGMEAEERGQGEAIARNLYEMSSLTCPVLSVFIGEGGSGGALAMAVANEVWMMENAVYSILSPEGFASILWKDAKRAPEAAEVMKLTSADLLQLGVIEKIIREPEEYTEDTMDEPLACIREAMKGFMNQYLPLDGTELAEQRYRRYRFF
ncbi:MAG: acetyl-CoA carboxylase carboxyltransferase subunit alpha [Lachnospiraceae bacterium]|nr:acetyl-CoA carboxylase carboxyltransferase subunit alpha [Lachnospiraceae bacterium]